MWFFAISIGNGPRSCVLEIVGYLLLDVVHGSDSSLGVILVSVADESKSTAPTSVAIFNHNLIITRTVSKLAK